MGCVVTSARAGQLLETPGTCRGTGPAELSIQRQSQYGTTAPGRKQTPDRLLAVGVRGPPPAGVASAWELRGTLWRGKLHQPSTMFLVNQVLPFSSWWF